MLYSLVNAMLSISLKLHFCFRHLDYEASQRHALTVVAYDGGNPPLSANLTLLVDVQDVNDNPPVFERPEYTVSVLESAPIDTLVSCLTVMFISM